MAQPTPPTPPYTVGQLEGAGVSFLGAFASTLGAAFATGSTTGHSVVDALVAGLGAFAAYLGYTAYQNS